MQIDNKHFLEFMQTMYFCGYFIKYIDKTPPIAKNTATIIDDDGNTKRLHYPLQKDLLRALTDLIKNQDYCQLVNPIIIAIFVRLGNAVICIKHKNF